MMSRSAAALLDFNDWLGELPHPLKVICGGNHDYTCEDPSRRHLINNATMLTNEGIVAMGLKIWGSPTTPLYGGAFGLSSEGDRIKLYSAIPTDTDILVSHGPPFGILDQVPGDSHHAGCRQLLDAVRRVRPMLHVFGHVHSGFGVLDTPETLFVNAALMGPTGSLDNRPLVIRIPRL